MSISTDLNTLTQPQELQVVGWIQRRLQECLEIDPVEDCADKASKIWSLHKNNDFYVDHSKTNEQVVEEGISYDTPEAQAQRVAVMLEEIAKILADSATFRAVVESEDMQAATRWLEETLQLLHFGRILVAVEVVTGT